MKIHILEPTLQDEAGHCFGYINSLIAANEKINLPLELWIGKNAANLFSEDAKTKVHPYFSTKHRLWQKFKLYRYLLKTTETIFVPTTTTVDLWLIYWLLGKHKRPKIFYNRS